MYKTFQIFFILVVLGSPPAGAQRSFAFIDHYVKDLGAPSPDSLARIITTPFFTEREKARAIYSWIAQNISYNTGIFPEARALRRYPVYDTDDDTLSVWSSGIEMTARRVLKRRTAICDGYSKLFATLCEYAGLRSEIITGYARNNSDRVVRFRTNHSWNAVMIDNNWYLVDVTWGSGYMNFANQFVHRLEERYFLADPGDFYMEHYPDDRSWTLLPDPPDYREYRKTPYKFKSFVKYQVEHLFPSNGWIQAFPGDTVKIEISLRNPERVKNISSDPFFDSTLAGRTSDAIFIDPTRVSGKRLYYEFVPGNLSLRWVYVMYNNDMILRYRISLLESPLHSKAPALSLQLLD
jgi:transglutaminase/protease-like cytokinesis protein 3